MPHWSHMPQWSLDATLPTRDGPPLLDIISHHRTRCMVGIYAHAVYTITLFVDDFKLVHSFIFVGSGIQLPPKGRRHGLGLQHSFIS